MLLQGVTEVVMTAFSKFHAHVGVIIAAAECLRCLTLDDDLRVPFGKVLLPFHLRHL